MTANAFMSGSLAPPLCIISVASKAKLHRAARDAGRTFGVSMLAQGQEAISRHFAGQGPTDPEVLFEHMDGVPVLANVCAALAAAGRGAARLRRPQTVRRPRIALRDDDRPPLVFHGGKYATCITSTTSAEAAIDFWELDHDARTGEHAVIASPRLRGEGDEHYASRGGGLSADCHVPHPGALPRRTLPLSGER